METLSEKVKELEKERDRLNFQRDRYRTMSILLYCAMRNDWVKEMVLNSEISFKFRTRFSLPEIRDYISRLEKE